MLLDQFYDWRRRQRQQQQRRRWCILSLYYKKRLNIAWFRSFYGRLHFEYLWTKTIVIKSSYVFLWICHFLSMKSIFIQLYQEINILKR